MSGARITLLTGGARCGKSRRALALAESYARKTYVATAQPIDDEMAERIMTHRSERGVEWETIESPLALPETLFQLKDDGRVAVVDCLTVWLGNVFHYEGAGAADARISEFVRALDGARIDLILVTNEVGWGIVPDNASARDFRDAAGRLNQDVARVADRVELLIAGIPMILKGEKR
ncbi:MAG: bifunctional adenosylcobinamide kinase/adenosylcobinamide-phosphate guanylyltransferase [Deltaproteobacteria bacterium]|nr:bifunctional adenosylcobinamide kinase/adenosylcobinamide-phosphate guanylyltransferase [Deltaproteobacteria bacterium]